ncbi:LysM peptidoglycan-binding domain-containing C40 family peptidase [Deinococcus hopiensis]|uniref:Cell wall-associated hydrolase, NlpC family n=1 Tax=Deinococcus hopiensis KR-140 TaxID=695939 RepID=A0A1W1UP28_9DEIO|nr:LysM peptidoglycan-binding domain-containing C40 family peptidase [Deinococcus hopiensis]SMB82826.1 Cell wall-associated hydrolase, NlpC family [Deinococcus hopiensis KR-140]
MNALRSLLTVLALCTPGASALTYTVKPGDTLSKIAVAHHTEPADLMRLNRLPSTTVKVGQRLNLGNVAAPTAWPRAQATGLSTSKGSAFVRTAASRFLGIRYALGGTGKGGIDCSAFTRQVFQQMGIQLPRTAAAQWNVGQAVNSRDLQAGDLVFFNTLGHGVSHVGVYVGGGMMANANSYQGRTVIEPMLSNAYWAARYLGARRVLS